MVSEEPVNWGSVSEDWSSQGVESPGPAARAKSWRAESRAEQKGFLIYACINLTNNDI